MLIDAKVVLALDWWVRALLDPKKERYNLMKIVIVYGNQRKGSTYNCVKIIKKKMQECGAIEFVEFFLPRELPYFCVGCFNCFLKGEQNCPHYSSVKPMVKAIINSHAVILTSPVYGFNVSGAMKAFIDHLCYLWMPHRPHKEMFSKIGMVISTTVGAGTKFTNKTMKNALNFMGVKRIFSYGFAVYAVSWEEVSLKTKRRIEKTLNKKAVKFFNTVKNGDKIPCRIYTKILFLMMKRLLSGYEDDNFDKKYWRQMGWLNKVKPF